VITVSHHGSKAGGGFAAVSLGRACRWATITFIIRGWLDMVL